MSSAFVSSVFVTTGGDVFAAGFETISGKQRGRVWKNGAVYFTEDDESEFTAVFVKE